MSEPLRQDVPAGQALPERSYAAEIKGHPGYELKGQKGKRRWRRTAEAAGELAGQSPEVEAARRVFGRQASVWKPEPNPHRMTLREYEGGRALLKNPHAARLLSQARRTGDYSQVLPGDVWYHGTLREFDAFGDAHRGARFGAEMNTRWGHHFADDPALAGMFARERLETGLPMVGRIIPVRLALRNPKIYPDTRKKLGVEWVQRQAELDAFRHAYANDPATADLIDEYAMENSYGRAQDKLAHSPEEWSWEDAFDYDPATFANEFPEQQAIGEMFLGYLRSLGHDGIVYPHDGPSGRPSAVIAFDTPSIEIAVGRRPHRAHVEEAARRGESLPASVLADYPDLAAGELAGQAGQATVRAPLVVEVDEDGGGMHAWRFGEDLRERFGDGLLFHGSTADFDMDQWRGGRTAHGIYFAEDPRTADIYRGVGDGRIVAARLRYDRLADFSDPRTLREVAEAGWLIRGEDEEADEEFQALVDEHESGSLYNNSMGRTQNTLVRSAEGLGYDAVRFNDASDVSTVVFRPTQIEPVAELRVKARRGGRSFAAKGHEFKGKTGYALRKAAGNVKRWQRVSELKEAAGQAGASPLIVKPGPGEVLVPARQASIIRPRLVVPPDAGERIALPPGSDWEELRDTTRTPSLIQLTHPTIPLRLRLARGVDGSLSPSALWVQERVLPRISARELHARANGPGRGEHDPSQSLVQLQSTNRTSSMVDMLVVPTDRDGVPLTERPQEWTIAPDARGGSYAELQRLYLRPEHRRRGVGGSLVRSQLDLMRKLGVVTVGTVAEGDGQDVWPRLGFVPVPRQDDDEQDDDGAFQQMELSLLDRGPRRAFAVPIREYKGKSGYELEGATGKRRWRRALEEAREEAREVAGQAATRRPDESWDEVLARGDGPLVVKPGEDLDWFNHSVRPHFGPLELRRALVGPHPLVSVEHSSAVLDLDSSDEDAPFTKLAITLRGHDGRSLMQGGSPETEAAHYQIPTYGEPLLTYIYLDPEFRGRGIGRSVVESQKRAFARMGFDEMWVLADGDGFDVWPRLGFRPPDGDDGDLMRVRLGRFRPRKPERSFAAKGHEFKGKTGYALRKAAGNVKRWQRVSELKEAAGQASQSPLLPLPPASDRPPRIDRATERDARRKTFDRRTGERIDLNPATGIPILQYQDALSRRIGGFALRETGGAAVSAPRDTPSHANREDAGERVRRWRSLVRDQPTLRENMAQVPLFGKVVEQDEWRVAYRDDAIATGREVARQSLANRNIEYYEDDLVPARVLAMPRNLTAARQGEALLDLDTMVANARRVARSPSEERRLVDEARREYAVGRVKQVVAAESIQWGSMVQQPSADGVVRLKHPTLPLEMVMYPMAYRAGAGEYSTALGEGGQWLRDEVLSKVSPEEFFEGVTGPGHPDHDPSRSRVSISAEADARRATLEHRLFSPDGAEIGSGAQERVLAAPGRGGGPASVHHSRFFLEPPYRGGGVGGRVIRSQLGLWKKLGFEQVTVSAAQDGQIVWPRMGFEPDDPTRPDELAREMVREVLPRRLDLRRRPAGADRQAMVDAIRADLLAQGRDAALIDQLIAQFLPEPPSMGSTPDGGLTHRRLARATKQHLLAGGMFPLAVGRVLRDWQLGVEDDGRAGAATVRTVLIKHLSRMSDRDNQRELAWGQTLKVAAQEHPRNPDLVVKRARDLERYDMRPAAHEMLRQSLEAYHLENGSHISSAVKGEPAERAAEAVTRRAWRKALRSSNMTLDLTTFDPLDKKLADK